MLPRVLLLTPKFYGIEEKIKSFIEKSGYEVVWFENKEMVLDYHGTRAKLKFFRHLWFLLFSPQSQYIQKKLNSAGDTRFDILFSINCFIICPSLFKELKNKNPHLYSVLYLWDSSMMYSWEKESRLFDKVFTFDLKDSETFGWNYLPVFFINDSLSGSPEIQHDIFLVGKFSPDRLRIIDKIINKLQETKVNYVIKLVPAFKNTLHNPLVFLFCRIIRIRTTWVKNYLLNYEVNEGIFKREFINSEPVKFEDVQKELSISNVILDIPYSNQTGYSHRLIEALARGKKVITTNLNIKNERFFNSEQIHILDDKNPEIDCTWIKEKSQFQVDNYFADLELSKWIKSVIYG